MTAETRRPPCITAFVSGKGGAGKTCVALSVARLTSLLGKRTLVIDADFATHGATYFLAVAGVQPSTMPPAQFLMRARELESRNHPGPAGARYPDTGLGFYFAASRADLARKQSDGEEARPSPCELLEEILTSWPDAFDHILIEAPFKV